MQAQIYENLVLHRNEAAIGAVDTMGSVIRVLAFSADQVCRLTGLSQRQLLYWDHTDFFSPAFREAIAHSPLARVYSFADIVGLRALAEMRNRYHVPLQRLRRVGTKLAERYSQPWSSLVFYVAGRRVYYEDEWLRLREAEHGSQHVMRFALTRVEGKVERAIERASRRKASQVGRVIRRRYVAQNQPVLAGTRIPTEAIWEFHAAGYTVDDILEQYSQIKPADVKRAIVYEARRKHKKVA